MSHNTSISSKTMLVQNGADETEAANNYPLSEVDGTSANVRQPLIPDMFEYWGIATSNRITNVVDQGLQNGHLACPPLMGTHGPLYQESAAQETPIPVEESLDWTKLGEIDLSLMNEYLNDPAAMTWDTLPYDLPASTQMGKFQGELAETFASSSVASQDSSNDSNIGHTMAHTPINYLDGVYEPEMGAISAPIHPSQQHMYVGPSRRKTNLPHLRGTPYRAIPSLHNPVPYHRVNDGLDFRGGAQNFQYTTTFPSPPFGETNNQNYKSEHQGRNELHGSGFTPVEPASSRNAGYSGNARRSEHQSELGSESSKRKRASRSSSGGASQGEKRAERIVRIDKYGNVVYKGMRPDIRTPREIEQEVGERRTDVG